MNSESVWMRLCNRGDLPSIVPVPDPCVLKVGSSVWVAPIVPSERRHVVDADALRKWISGLPRIGIVLRTSHSSSSPTKHLTVSNDGTSVLTSLVVVTNRLKSRLPLKTRYRKDVDGAKVRLLLCVVSTKDEAVLSAQVWRDPGCQGNVHAGGAYMSSIGPS